MKRGGGGGRGRQSVTGMEDAIVDVKMVKRDRWIETSMERQVDQ